MSSRFTIMIYGFVALDADNRPCRISGKPPHSTEHNGDPTIECDGWNVWVRDDSIEPFLDVYALDRYFDTLASAKEYADALSLISGAEIDAY